MKIKSTLLIILIFLVTNCGFKPIYSSKASNFKINEIELIQKNKLNSTIKNNLSNYSNEEGNKEFNIKISSQKEIGIGSKDSKGNASTFKLIVKSQVIITKNGNIKNEREFSTEFNYNNSDKKFELKQYEKNIQENLTNKLIEQIIRYLYEN